MESGGGSLGGGGINCPYCRCSIPSDASFCPHCGARLREAPPRAVPPPAYAPQKSGFGVLIDIIRGVGTYSSLILLMLLIVNVLIAIWGITVVVPETEGSSTYLFIVTPWIVNFAELSGASFAIYHILMVVFIVLSFAWLVRRSAPRFLQEMFMGDLDKEHSPLYVLGTLFFSLLAFNMIYYFVIGLFGVSPTTPGFGEDELWKMLYNLARASVWEELITRVLLIGVPLLAVHMFMKRRGRWRSYFLGGDFKMGRLEVSLIIISSAVFAAAHLVSWDVFKVPPTFLAGLAMGYLFLRFGLYGAIMLHFAFDYLSVPLAVWDSLVVILILGLMILAWLIIGIAYFVGYAMKAVDYLTGKNLWPLSAMEGGKVTDYNPFMAAPPQAEYDPSRQGFGFVCKYCGSTEARYKDGEFTCMRCGRVS